MYCIVRKGWSVLQSAFRMTVKRMKHEGSSSPQNATVLKLLELIQEKDRTLAGLIQEKDRTLQEKDRTLEGLHKELLTKSMDLKDSDFNLQRMTLKYLQSTSSVDARSIIEIFQSRYVRASKGKSEEGWNNFIHSEHSVALNVMRELKKVYTDTSKTGRIMKDLYARLSQQIHQSEKSSTKLYLVRDNFTPDELVLMKCIADHVISKDNVIVVSEKDWKLLVSADKTE